MTRTKSLDIRLGLYTMLYNVTIICVFIYLLVGGRSDELDLASITRIYSRKEVGGPIYGLFGLCAANALLGLFTFIVAFKDYESLYNFCKALYKLSLLIDLSVMLCIGLYLYGIGQYLQNDLVNTLRDNYKVSCQQKTSEIGTDLHIPFYPNGSISKSMDAFQVKNFCCGVNGAVDFGPGDVPISCCNSSGNVNTGNSTTKCPAEQANLGCKKELKKYLNKRFVPAIGYSFGSIGIVPKVLYLIWPVVSLCLEKIRSRQERTKRAKMSRAELEFADKREQTFKNFDWGGMNRLHNSF